MRLFLTCEHGGREIPPRYRSLFLGKEELLASHRGWDPGALKLAKFLSRRLRVPLIAAVTTRLLVDLNRSPENPAVIAREISHGLSTEERVSLLRSFHQTHWNKVRAAVAEMAEKGPVLHIGIHSFTPILHGKTREVDVGLLYDPRRPGENRLGKAWQNLLRASLPGRRIRRNLPYRGWTDGLVTVLRQEWPGDRYLGFELEVNQGLLDVGGGFPPEIGTALEATLRQAIGTLVNVNR